MNGAQVRRELIEIREWKAGLTDNVASILGISASQYVYVGGGQPSGLTGKVAATLDDDSRGAAGFHREEGVDEIMASYAQAFASDRAEPTPDDVYSYLARMDVIAWAERQADWDVFADDVHTAHERIARITGHAPVTIGKCPKMLNINGRVEPCGGDVQAEVTKHGTTTWGVCVRCETWYADVDAITKAAIVEMRSIAVNPETTITTSEALKIWPELKRDDIKNWLRSGRLDKPINLRTFNILATKLVEKRARRDVAVGSQVG